MTTFPKMTISFKYQNMYSTDTFSNKVLNDQAVKYISLVSIKIRTVKYVQQ